MPVIFNYPSSIHLYHSIRGTPFTGIFFWCTPNFASICLGARVREFWSANFRPKIFFIKKFLSWIFFYFFWIFILSQNSRFHACHFKQYWTSATLVRRYWEVKKVEYKRKIRHNSSLWKRKTRYFNFHCLKFEFVSTVTYLKLVLIMMLHIRSRFISTLLEFWIIVISSHLA